MTKEEAQETVSGALGMLWTATVRHLNESKIMYGVLIAVSVGVWNFALKNQIEAWAGEVSINALKEAVAAPCYNDPTDIRHNPHSLACQKENEIAAEEQQTQAITDLNSRFDAYIETQAQIEIKRAQENEQIIRLLQGMQPR